MRTRTTRDINVANLVEALKRPGIDTRDWLKLANVKEVQMLKSGVNLICSTIPEDYEVEARLATIYAGVGFGIYAPVQVDDLVVLLIPDGDPNNLTLALGAVHTSVDTLSQDVIDDPQNLWIIVESGKNITIDADEIKIGSKDADNPAVMGFELTSLLTNLLVSLMTHTHIDSLGGIPSNLGEIAGMVGDINGIKSAFIKLQKTR